MPELAKLRKERGGRRARINIIIRKLEDDEISRELSTEAIESYIDELGSQREKLTTLDDEILQLSEAEDYTREIDESSEFRTKVNTILKKVQKRKTTTKSSVKLPNIQLEHFSGDPLKWSKFYDLFRSSIHDRTDLAPSAKFHYLQTQLEGEAARLLAGFDNTAAEYEEAFELLKNTYGKPKLLIQARLNALFDIKTPEPSSTSLSDFRSTYEGHLRALKSLGCDIDSAGYVYAELLLRKLPEKTRDHINRASNTDTWNLPDLRSAIAAEIQHLYAIDRDYEHEKDLYRRSYDDHNKSASFNVVTNKSSNKYRPTKCNYCNGEHASIRCNSYVSLGERRARIAELKLCYNCLKGKHVSFDCSNTGRCNKCSRKHHTSICDGEKNRSVPSVKSKTSERSTQKVSENVKSNTSMNTIPCSSNSQSNLTSVLPTAQVKIILNNSEVQCRALLDTGAQRSFIDEDLVKNFNLPITKQISLCVDGFGSLGSNKLYNVATFDVKCSDGLVSMDAIVTKSIPNRLVMPGRSAVIEDLTKMGYELADPTVNTDNFSDIQLMIGIDNYGRFTYNQNVKPNVFVIPSKLGNLVGGTISAGTVASNVVTILKVATSDTSLDDELKKLWELENIGIKSPSSNDDEAIKKFERSISYSNGKYTASLPWKDEDVNLPTNRTLALNRTNSLLNSLRKDEKLLHIYNDLIKEQLKSDFIEKIPDNCEVSPSSKVHYIPHHPVHKDSVTTPVRIVYDCSAKCSKYSKSLNDCLHTGPSLVNELAGVLLRFRLGKVACTADIAKAYLMVRLSEDDRNSCRFFWPANPFDEHSEMETYRFKVVLFGSTASQFLLNSTINHHLSNLNTNLSRNILRNIYIDNLHGTFDDDRQLINFYDESKITMNKAGFKLREWSTNSETARKYMCTNRDLTVKTSVKVLGISWDTISDKLSLCEPKFKDRPKITKRTVVSEFSKLFDPFGWCLPVTVRGKLFIQNLWRNEISWDEPLSDEQCTEWNSIMSDVKSVINLYNPERRLFAVDNPTLHVFADSSTKCYGAVAYFVSEKIVDFVMAKSKLAPIKAPTLPQLELTALSIAARLAKFIYDSFAEELKFNQIVLWTDSQITYQWFYSNKISKPYVNQRVVEIKSLLPDAYVKLVPGSENPADLLTRGVTADKLAKSSPWSSGSEVMFLPIVDTETNINCVVDQLEQSDPFQLSYQSCSVSSNVNCEQIIPLTRFSTYNKAIRVTMLVIKFIHKLKAKLGTQSVDNITDVESAENCLIKLVQRENFPQIFAYFDNETKTKPSIVNQLDLFLDKLGIVRCKTRLGNSKLLSDSINPILLPTKSYFTKLVILREHEANCHSGPNETLASIRQRFWIPRARCVIKSVIRRCVKCLKVSAKSYNPPPVPDLPGDRVTQSRPFQISGVDYTGAISVRGAPDGRAYIVLFTCAVTRAVHLEVAQDNSEAEFLAAFIRFTSRRSYPQTIYSDNASNFIAANKTLQSIANSESVVNKLNEYKVKWKFITPRAAWHGGMWERLIGLMKSSLKKVVGNALLTIGELTTLVTQIEAKMNDRPITFVSDQFDDPEPLTPSMLLTGCRINSFPSSFAEKELLDPTYGSSTPSHQKRLLFLQSKLDHLWRRWQKEYLTLLRERFNKSSEKMKIPEIGRIVLIHGDNKRVHWKLGRITSLLYGKDGYVRSASVRTSNGVLSRPITKLYPLEIDCENVEDSVKFDTCISNNRTARKAAIKAAQLNKKLFTVEN